MRKEHDIYEMEYFDLSGDKKVRQKRMKIFIAVFAVLYVLGLWLNFRPGILVDGDFYVKKGDGKYVSGKNTVEVAQNGENEVVVEGYVDKSHFFTRLTWEDIEQPYDVKRFIIRFDGKAYAGTWGSDTPRLSWDYYRTEVEGENMASSVYDRMDYERYTEETYITCAIVFGKEVRDSNIGGFLIACLLYIVGVIIYKMPDEQYEKITEPWGFNSDENLQIGIVVKYILAYGLVIFGGFLMLVEIFRLL